jgi:Holliday junction resolvase RusA-like endonuclease
MADAIEFTILGQTYSLKNTRDIFPIKAEKGSKCPYCKKPLRMITVPNSKAKQFERDFKNQIPHSAQQGLLGAVRADIEIFYPSNLQDLDEALVLDLMEKYGVVGNDRQVVAKYVTKRICPENPRVHVQIHPVRWERSGRQPGLLDDESMSPVVHGVV